MNLLIPNLGSTSLKYQVLEMPSERLLAKGRLERVTNYREAIEQIRTGETPIDAVAPQGGAWRPRYRGTFVVDERWSRPCVSFFRRRRRTMRFT